MGVTTNSFLGVKNTLDEYTATIGAGTDATLTITPPAGVCYQLIGCRVFMNAPGGASSGSHSINMGTPAASNLTTSGNTPIRLVSAFNQSVAIYYGGANFVGTTSEFPTNETDQIAVLLGGMIWCNAGNPFKVLYDNQTDADQTEDLDFYGLWKVWKDVL